MASVRDRGVSLGRVVATSLAMGLIVVGCGGSEGASQTDESEEDHQSALAIGETPFITRFLVPVDGYRYVNDHGGAYENVMKRNDAWEAEIGRDFFGAISLHSVVAGDDSQNTARAWNGDSEVGYLVLEQLVEPVPYGVDDQLATAMGGRPPLDRMKMSGVPVFVFENPASTDSRFTYVWVNHGVVGFIDGADREPLERWLDAYLATPKLAERETAELDARLIDVSGFSYSNVDTSTLPAQVVDGMGEVSFSMHKVVNTDGSIGVLTLTQTDDVGHIGRWLSDAFSLDGSKEIAIGDRQVRRLSGVVDGNQMHAMAWNEAGMSGALTTNAADLDTAERFLASFLHSD